MELWRDLEIAGRELGYVDRIRHICDAARGKRVLHVGCADYPITVERIERRQLLHDHLTAAADECLGIDLSAEGIAMLRAHGRDNVRVLDAVRIRELDMRFDLVVASDVLEHMTNPASFLEVVPDCLNPGGELLISLPNAFSWTILRPLLQNMEPTHYDHCFCFSVKTIAELCHRCGLRPVELAYSMQPPDEESPLFLWARSALVKFKPRMAPTFLMMFQASGGPGRDGRAVYR
jgi:predicted TPR repeat methyltransferase